ncbi:hypothetical protein Amal_03956 [Acetobacter malorum]|uniref:Uncharacterized protein n=1 Tax=Acetobacter malorum TaxID=178901 RepID=A0A177G3T0_9PROT|nr:hypothetical protein Amal_03956 [Acetobacter malorum]
MLHILALTGGRADQFNGGIGKHHALHEDKCGQQTMWKQAAILGDEVQAGGLTSNGHAQAKDCGTNNQEQAKGCNFDEREPEFQLPKPAYADHVHPGNEDEGE